MPNGHLQVVFKGFYGPFPFLHKIIMDYHFCIHLILIVAIQEDIGRPSP